MRKRGHIEERGINYTAPLKCHFETNCFLRARLQALTALRQGNASEILGLLFVGLGPIWSVMILGFRSQRNFGVVAGFCFLIVLELEVVELSFLQELPSSLC